MVLVLAVTAWADISRGVQSGSMQFATARESMKSPLAKKLFQVDGVTNVFFGSDFVTVTKSDDYTWNVVKPDIFAGIMDHFTSGKPSSSACVHSITH